MQTPVEQKDMKDGLQEKEGDLWKKETRLWCNKKFAELENEEENLVKDEVARKSIPAEERKMMEIARNWNIRKNEDDVQGIMRENIEQINTNIRKGQVYVIRKCVLRKIDRPVFRPRE